MKSAPVPGVFDDSLERTVSFLVAGATLPGPQPALRIQLMSDDTLYYEVFPMVGNHESLDILVDRAYDEIVALGDPVIRGCYVMAYLGDVPPFGDNSGMGTAVFPDGRALEITAGPATDADIEASELDEVPEGYVAASVKTLDYTITPANPLSMVTVYLARKLWGEAWAPAPEHGPDCDCGGAA